VGGTSTGASPLRRSETFLLVASFRCNLLECLARPFKPPAPHSLSATLAFSAAGLIEARNLPKIRLTDAI
jgi:hypothetical protein